MMEPTTKPLLLIVEDELSLVALLRYNFEKEGFQVCDAQDGETALNLVQSSKPDLVILDWMLPTINGIDVCRHIRRIPKIRETPVIMLTARGEEENKIRGLNMGADDYLVKPFSVPELIARVKALLRRVRRADKKEFLVYQDIAMDMTSRKVTRSGQQIHLSPTEFRILQLMLKNPGQVFSREELLEHAWGVGIYVEVRTVDVHIRRLRKALNIIPGNDVIRTVRASGYSLDGDV